MAEKERNNEKVFLETYKKGQMSALFERNEEVKELLNISLDVRMKYRYINEN